MSKDEVERSLAKIMDEIPAIEGIVATDLKGNIITGKTIVEMDLDKIVQNLVKIAEASGGLTTIEKGNVQEVDITFDDGFALILCSGDKIIMAFAGQDAKSDRVLISMNLKRALEVFS